MKILILSQYFWPESFRINDVAKSLSDMGNEIDILTAKPNYPIGKLFDGYKLFSFDETIYNNLRIFRVPIVTRGRNNAVRLALNYLSFVIIGSIYSILKFRKSQYEVIYVYSTSPIFQAIPGLLLSKIKRIPIVLNLQDLWPESLSATGYIKNKKFLNLIDFVVRLIYKNCDLILVSSKPFIKQLKKYNLSCPVKYFPNSVDSIFYEKPKTNFLKIKELELGFKVVFAGNLGKAQSLDTIIGLSKKLLKHKKIKIILFGDGSEYEYILQKKKIENLDNLFLMGSYPIEKMPFIFSKADVLLATLSDRECFSNTLPNKIQAYMTAKRPIVVSMNGEGSRIIKESKSGFAAPAENVPLLVDAILRVYNMKIKERNKLSENSFKYFKDYFYHPRLMDKLDKELKMLISKE